MEYDHREYLLDDLYEARKRWAKRDWIVTPRVMGSVACGGTGIDDAIMALREYDLGVAEFDAVFGDGAANQFDAYTNGGV